MLSKRNIAILLFVTLGVLLSIVLFPRRLHRFVGPPLSITGSVVKQNSDSHRESPIADVQISTSPELGIGTVKSDFSGFFKIELPPAIDPGESIQLHFRHPDYGPVDLKATVSDRLFVVPMIPIHGEIESDLNEAETVLANVLIRYATEITTTENIGTAVKTFQVVNTGNVPCYERKPCSPDGKWKAAIESASLDAGDGNVFQNARISCIAGPCPFTKIESDDFSRPARTVKASVRNWSNTTTFLLQAEVFHTQARDTVRKAYPIIFGRSMNFTLPSNAQGVTLEAELNGAQIIFPLSPEPELSWADCKLKIEENQSKDYRCELKSGYRFR